MVEERTCDFTGKPIEPGTGIMYVRADGTVLHFVDAKAEKNYFKGREARDLPWTEAGRAQKAERARVANEGAAGPADPEPATDAVETPAEEPATDLESEPEAADETTPDEVPTAEQDTSLSDEEVPLPDEDEQDPTDAAGNRPEDDVETVGDEEDDTHPADDAEASEE